MKNINWAQLYAPENVTAWQLPDTKAADPENGVFRDIQINWSDLPTKDESGEPVPLWFICCDILRIDTTLVLDVSAVIFARRIEVAPSVNLILSRFDDAAPELLIYTQEVVASDTFEKVGLPIFLVNIDESEVHHSLETTEEHPITGLSWKDGDQQPTSLAGEAIHQSFVSFGEPLDLMLNTQFQLSMLLSSEAIDASIALMQWVGNLAVGNQETRELAGQAQAALMTMVATQSIADMDTVLVPQLDLKIYASKAAAFLNILKFHEQQWERLQDRITNIDQWLDDAKNTVWVSQNDLELSQNLEAQAQETWENAREAKRVAAAQIVAQQKLLRESMHEFQLGIERWKDGRIQDEVFNLVTGVSEVLAQIPVIITTGPGLVPGEAFTSIAESAIIAAEAQDTVLNTALKKEPKSTLADDLKKRKSESTKDRARLQESGNKIAEAGKKAGSGAAKAVNAGLNIASVIKRASELEATSEAILAASFEAIDEAFSTISLQGIDVVTGGSQIWGLIAEDLDNTFEEITELREIEGGAAYRLALRKLVIHGKVLSEARLAVAEANARYAEMRMRRQAAAKAVALFEERADGLDAQSAQAEALSQLAFRKMVTDKRAVYLAMEAYNRAFQYFTLTDAIVLPRITAPYESFAKTVSTVAGASLELDALGNPPQTMENIEFSSSNEELLRSLRQDHFVNWELSTDNPMFNELGRVRLSEIRVFLYGLTTNEDIEVKVTTSGHYSDKSARGVHKFVAEPMRIRMIYHENGNGREVNVHADIAQRFTNDFFHPTPFTTWSFHFSSRDESPLDLSTVTGILVSFDGEVTTIS
jgi:hypothetical protein